MPKVSVIIPIYKVEKYIERCAISLFEQTLNDIEYIFINDCTTDNSMGILQEIISRYPNRQSQVHVFDLPINNGLPAVRKYGLQYAKGEYIAHCDSDDWLDKTAYEKLYYRAIQDNSDIVFCDYYKSNGIQHSLIERNIDTRSKNTIIKSVSKKAYWTVWSALVRHSIYTDNQIIYPAQNNGEDFALMFQLIYYARSFSKINEALYYYYFNPDSISNVLTENAYIKRYNQLIINTELIIDFIKGNNEISQYENLIMLYKLYCRTKITPLTNQKKYLALWKSTFPELKTSKILTNFIIPLRTKLNYLAVITNIYYLIHK